MKQSALKFRKMLSGERYKAWLQIFLAATLFLYLYSPFLDHWLGNTHYGRPHTHISLPAAVLSAASGNAEAAPAAHEGGHEAHEEDVLCLLDIDALLIVLDFDVRPNFWPGPNLDASLVFDFQAALMTANPIFVSALDPPPRI
jgi:hypothetical protein